MLPTILLVVLVVLWSILWIGAITVVAINYVGAMRLDEAPSTLAKVGGGLALVGILIPCGPFQMVALVGLVISSIAGMTSGNYADQRIARGVQIGVVGLVIGSILLCGGFGCCSSLLDAQNQQNY